MKRKKEIKLHDKIKTPDGVITVQSICYDTKTGKYSYSILGPKSKFYSEDVVELVENG